MGGARQGGQYQVIIGNDVTVCYQAVLKAGDFSTAEEKEGTKKGKKRFTLKGWANSVLDMVSGSVTPLLPALIGCGMVKLLLILLDLFQVPGSLPTYRILSAAADSAFYFMPILLAWSASKKLNCNSVLAINIVAVLVHPDITALLSGGSSSFLRISVTQATYRCSQRPDGLLWGSIQQLCHLL